MSKGSLTTTNFTHEVSGVARTLGRDIGLNIVFAGENAKTDGSTIYLPSLPEGVTMNPQDAGVLRGYGDHETFHVRKTDSELFSKALTEKGYNSAGQPSQFAKYLQACEDMRIERYGTDEYPGTKAHIADTVESLIAQHHVALKVNPGLGSNVDAAAPLAITLEGRRRMGIASTACEALLDKLSPNVRKIAEATMDYIEAYVRDDQIGTIDSIELAASLATDGCPPPKGGDSGEGKGKGDKPDKPEKGEGKDASKGKGKGKGQDSGEGEGEGEASEGSGEADGEGKDESEPSDVGAGGISGGDPDSQDEEATDKSSFTLGGDRQGGKGAGSGAFGEEGAEKVIRLSAKDIDRILSGLKADKSSTHNPLNTELSKAAENTATRVSKTKIDGDLPPLRVADPSKDKWHTRTNRQSMQGGTDKYDEAVARSAGQLNVMRRKLERMIISRSSRGWEQGCETGTLNPKRLTQAAMGVPTVYRRRDEVQDMDTSVCVLIDLSGSMTGEPAVLAQEVAIAIAQCLQAVGAEFAIYGFNNGYGGYQSTFERSERQNIYVFKDFKDTLRDARESLGTIADHAGGNNCDPSAIWAAWSMLRQRQTKRKVLITLSDGSPAWYVGGAGARIGSYKAKITRYAVRDIMSQGCECAGIGIMDESVKEFYPVWAVANSLDEFGGKALDTIAKMLLGDRVRVSNAFGEAA